MGEERRARTRRGGGLRRAPSPTTARPRPSSASARTLREVGELARTLDGEGAFALREEVVVSAGGSVFFDEVADALATLALSRPTRVVLRSGCYLTHDHAHYARLSPLGDRLRPALELWAEVTPSPRTASPSSASASASHVLELPILFAVRRHAATDDQHAYLGRGRRGNFEVGDLSWASASTPLCTAFDKWRLLPLVDEDYRVTGGPRGSPDPRYAGGGSSGERGVLVGK